MKPVALKNAAAIWRMRQFHEEYSQNEKLSPVVREKAGATAFTTAHEIPTVHIS